MIVFNINPETAGVFGFTLFYSSLFLALVGAFSLIGLGVRRVFKKHDLEFRQVRISFRQGVWFSFFFVGALFLQSQEILTLTNGLLSILALTVIELFFLSRNIKK